MESTKFVSNNPLTGDASYNQKLVTVRDFNYLYDDLVAIRNAVGLDASLTSTVSTTTYTATGSLTAAQIIGNSAGTLGHANGVELVPAPGAGYVFELISAVLVLDYAGAAYTGGGTDLYIRVGTVNECAAITAAQLVNSAADAILGLNLLATNVVLTANTNINLKCTTAFTQPGSAAGLLRYKVSYRTIATGLA
jgi:hypothetical protein